jgi:hypothetical protein
MKLFSLLYALAFLLPAQARLQAQSAPAKSYLNQGGLASRNFTDTIPFEFTKHKVIVEVTIGRRPWRFLMDTGAPLAISRNLQDELQFQRVHRELVGDINGRADSLDFVRVTELNLGRTRVQNVPALVLDGANPLLGCFGVDGIIGSNLLRQTVVRFNAEDLTIILTDRAQRLGLDPRSGTAMELDPVQSTPMVRLQPFRGLNEWVVFDSGADELYSMSLRSFHYFRRETDLEPFIRSTGYGSDEVGLYGLGEDTTQYLLQLQHLRVNATEFSNVLVATTVDDHSRLGAELLDHGIVTLDYPNARFHFQHFQERPHIDCQDKRFGFTFRPDGEGLRIGLVWKKSDAYALGIRPNWQVLQINNLRFAGKPMCELLFLISQEFAEKERVELTLRDERGRIRKVEVIRAL